VFEELANGTGYKVKGWADAAALGIWPSRGYELHGYEFKESREDLKKELRDPEKADNIGKYCHHWWLCLRDEKLMEGLVVPAVWGILVPKGRVLRTVRKAPRTAKPKPFDPAFVAAMIRNVTKTWVPKHEHEELKKNAHEQALVELARDRKYSKEDAEYERDRLGGLVRDFKAKSGVDIEVPNWQLGDIAAAVKLVMEARSLAGKNSTQHWRTPDAGELVRREIADVERAAAKHDSAAAGMRAAAHDLRQLLERVVVDPEHALDMLRAAPDDPTGKYKPNVAPEAREAK
jgi:hypothetical protein